MVIDAIIQGLRLDYTSYLISPPDPFTSHEANMYLIQGMKYKLLESAL